MLSSDNDQGTVSAAIGAYTVRHMDNADGSLTPRLEVTDQSPVPNDDPDRDVAPRKRPGRRFIVIAVASLLLIMIVAGLAVYWLLSRDNKTTPSPEATAQQSNQQTIQPAPDTADTGTDSSGQYMSNGKDLNLSFTYPSGWSVTPVSGDNTDDQPVVVTSPLLSMTNASGSSVTGKVVFMIRPGSSEITELSGGTATAAAASAQIAYTKPTTSQHQYPYITFIHLKGGQNPSGLFEEVMITGVNQFAKGQGITSFSLSQLDPIITAAFYQCTTQSCTDTGATPLSITTSTWQNDDTFKQLEAIFESLQLN